MAIIDEDGLSRLLKTDVREHIWCIFGDDSYLKEFYCEKLVGLTVAENLKLFNFHVYEDRETELEDIFADADNLPVMSERTCLLIKDFPLNALGAEQVKAFEKRLADAPESAVLIFYFNKLPVSADRKNNAKWAAFVDLFSKYGTAVNLSHRTRAKTVKMLMRGAAARGTSIGQAEAEYLIDTVGDDMQNLLNEFNKICAFADGSPVTKEMIDEAAVKTVEASVFDISTALFNGDADKAFATVNELLRQKTPLQSILGALAGAYVNIYRLKTALDSGHTADDFAEALGYNKKTYPYVFRNVAVFTRKSSREKIAQAIELLTQTDIRSKSGGTDDRTLLTELLAELAALAG